MASSRPSWPATWSRKLKDLGKDVTIHIHPGADHAFFNDSRPEVYNEAESAAAWADTIELFRSTLGR